LQYFSDDKAYRIAERLMGVRPPVPNNAITPDKHARAKRSVSNLRYRALNNGISLSNCFNFDTLLQMGIFVDRCPYSGLFLSYKYKAGKGAHFNSPSFDRIDPSSGYAAWNVQVVSMAVNALKSDMPISQMPRLLHAIKFLHTAEYFDSHVPLCVR